MKYKYCNANLLSGQLIMLFKANNVVLKYKYYCWRYIKTKLYKKNKKGRKYSLDISPLAPPPHKS